MDIQEVARIANVSTATISRVLNGSPKVKPETFKRIKQVIEDLRYVPNTSARTLRVGRSQLLGLIVSDINNPFSRNLLIRSKLKPVSGTSMSSLPTPTTKVIASNIASSA